jgi:hypothetical protein
MINFFFTGIVIRMTAISTHSFSYINQYNNNKKMIEMQDALHVKNAFHAPRGNQLFQNLNHVTV